MIDISTVRRYIELVQNVIGENIDPEKKRVMKSMLGEVREYIEMLVKHTFEYKQITDEEAIDHLQRSGWLQKHEELLTVDSVAAIVNRIMRDGDKTISVSIYPWNDEDEK